MKFRTKLSLGLAVIVLLVVAQWFVDLWQSAAVSHDMRQLDRVILRQFNGAFSMSVLLGDLEIHLLSAQDLAADTEVRNAFIRKGNVLLERLHTSIVDAAKLNEAVNPSMLVGDGSIEQKQFRDRREILKRLGTGCVQVEAGWQRFTNSLPTFTKTAIAQSGQALALSLHAQVRSEFSAYAGNLASETFRETHELISKYEATRSLLLLAAALTGLTALAATIFLAKLVLRPLNVITDACHAVAGGNRDIRVHLERQDEFGLMAGALNVMLDSLQATTVSRDELERLLRQRTAELERFFSASPDPMLICDTQGHLVRFNASFSNSFGYAEGALLGSRKDKLHPEDVPLLREALQRLASRKADYFEVELRSQTTDGSWKTYSWKGVLAQDQDLVYATGRDVTELRATTAALRKSEQNLATTLNSIGDGVLATDAQGRITRLNPVAEELTGWCSADAAGHYVDEVVRIIHEQTREVIPNPVHAALAESKTVGLSSHSILISRHDEERPIADSCAPIRDANNEIIGTVFVFRDVTREREAEQQLLERETMLRTLANNLPSGAAFRLLTNNDTGAEVFEFISEGVERLTGLPVSEIQADAQKLIGLIHPDDAPILLKAKAVTVQGSLPFDCQVRIRTASGEIRWVHWRSTPHRLANGEFAWDGLIVDITPLKAAEQQLQVLNENLEQKVRQRTAALAESERGQRTLLANLQGMAYRCRNDEHWTMEFVSDACRAILGLDPEKAVADKVTFESIMHPDDRKHVHEAVDRALAANSQFAVEYRLRHADGTWRWVWEQGRFVVNENQAPEFIEGYITDVTQRKQAEEALAQQERRQSSLFRALPAGVGQVKNRVLLEVNQRVCEMTGYSMEELIGKGARLLYATQEAYEQVGHRLYSDSPDRTIGSIETHWRRKDGTSVDVLLSSCRLDAEDPTHLVITVTDITELKRAQAQLNILSQAIEQSPVSVMITNPRGEIEYVNAHFTEITGYQPNEVSGKNPRLLQSGQTPRESYQELWRTLTSGGRWYGQFCNKKRNGELFWEFASISPIRNPQGVLTHFLAFKEDVTERRKSHERMREQAALLDQTQDAILVLGLNRRITYYNRSAKEFYVGSGVALLGRVADEILFPAQPARCAEVCNMTIQRGEWSGELRVPRDQGQVRILRSRWALIRDAAGQPQDILVTNTDITDQKRLEDQFLRAQRMESVGTLAGGVAHDLNNILTPILMATEVFRPVVQGTDHEPVLDMLTDSVHRGAGIVRQLLMFGRGVTGQSADLQPRSLIKEMAKVIKETFPKNIAFEQRLTTDLWLIHADPTQIHQVLMNLCVNARDAMPDGGDLTITAENVTLDEFFVEANPEAKLGRYVLLQVSDTGTGIPLAILDRIFDPFFTTKEQGKGTGLGLSTVLGIVKGHGGFVQVCTSPTEGTTFKVYLPASESATVQPATSQLSHLPRGNAELVLVVDDEEAIRNVARRILEKNGYRVIVATNGAEGLVTYAHNMDLIRVVLTDMMMPAMDGVTLIRSLRSYTPELPIIAMSGLLEQEQESAKSGAKIDGFISKPFSSERLLVALHEVLSSASPTSEYSGEGVGSGSAS
jgi:PAS domain S-box-containing protein